MAWPLMNDLMRERKRRSNCNPSQTRRAESLRSSKVLTPKGKRNPGLVRFASCKSISSLSLKLGHAPWVRSHKKKGVPAIQISSIVDSHEPSAVLIRGRLQLHPPLLCLRPPISFSTTSPVAASLVTDFTYTHTYTRLRESAS